MAAGFADDSFFTLTRPEQAGLAVLSVLVLLGLAVIAYQLVRRFGRGIGLIAASAMYLVFLWIAPQVYYVYYRAIFDGLPMQWVIGAAPDFRPIVFLAHENLSQIAQGLGFWVVLLAGWMGGSQPRSA